MRSKAQTPLTRFFVDLLYNKLYNKSKNKSTSDRISGVELNSAVVWLVDRFEVIRNNETVTIHSQNSVYVVFTEHE